MAIFTRRALQRVIKENERFLSADQVSRKVRILNDPDPSNDWIATEWELVVLNVFSHLGKVEHEPASPGTTRPDMHFTPHGAGKPVAIEIVVVSDRGLHKENPFELLVEELTRRTLALNSRGIKGSFILNVAPRTLNVFRGSEPMRLKLPKVSRIPSAIFNRNFSNFISEIVRKPRDQHTYMVKDPETEVTIAFSPQLKGLSAGHVAFTLAHSLRRNPVARALFRKAKKLKQCGLPGPYGIVLCDGGCDMLAAPPTWSTFSLKEVVGDFLRQNTSVGFVLLVRICPQRPFSPSALAIQIESELHRGARWPEMEPDISACLAQMEGLFPRPHKTAVNARLHLDWHRRVGLWNEGDSLFGGLKVSDNKVSISARTILELLEGRHTTSKLSKAYDFDRWNPFAHNLKSGRAIVSAKIERSELSEDDDEWLTFEFGEPDPAISAFKVPDAHDSPSKSQ